MDIPKELAGTWVESVSKKQFTITPDFKAHVSNGPLAGRNLIFTVKWNEPLGKFALVAPQIGFYNAFVEVNGNELTIDELSGGGDLIVDPETKEILSGFTRVVFNREKLPS